MKMSIKRFICVLLTLLLLTVFVSGCAKNSANNSEEAKGSEQTKQSEQVKDEVKQPTEEEKKGFELKAGTIKYYTGAAYDQVELEASLNDFKEKYPMINVEVIVIADGFDTKMRTAIVAGEQVDVVATNMITFERSAPEGIYIPLDDLIKQDGYDVEKEYGGYLNHFKVDNIQYALPKFISDVGVWYNREHFSEAGIPYPTAEWTWDEFFELAKKLTVKDENGKIKRYGAFDWSINEAALGNMIAGAALYSGWEIVKEDGSPNIDDPRLKKFINLYYNAMLVDKSMPAPADVSAGKLHYAYDMYKGKWSMCIQGRTVLWQDYHVEYGQLSKEDDEKDVFMPTYMPRGDKNSSLKPAYDVATADAICKNTKNPNEAYVFVKWHSTSSIELASKAAHRIPAAASLNKDVLFENWKYYKNKAGEIVPGRDRTEGYKIMMDPEINPIAPLNQFKYGYSKMMLDALNKEMSLLFAGQGTIDEAIAGTKAECERIYNEEKSK